MIRYIIVPMVCVIGCLGLIAVWSQVDATNDAIRLEQRR